MKGTASDEHIIEAIGKARVVIRNGGGRFRRGPLVRECPLARRFGKPVLAITPDAIRENMEFRIQSFGMCTPERVVEAEGDFVGFGASELLSCGLSSGLLDCAVIACEGAGTVVVTRPSLVQGIGGRMSGLVSTSPIPQVMERIQARGGIVIDTVAARIDQANGVLVAEKRGFARIGVTVASPGDARSIRMDFPGARIIAVHTTGISREEALVLAHNADIITACASRHAREQAGPAALLQAGVSIPVFAMTEAGKALVLEKVRCSPAPVVLSNSKLPATHGDEPRPLV